jgi:hypothetical protein
LSEGLGCTAHEAKARGTVSSTRNGRDLEDRLVFLKQQGAGVRAVLAVASGMEFVVNDSSLKAEDGEEHAFWKPLRWDVLRAVRPCGAKSSTNTLLEMVRPKDVHRVPLKARDFSEGHHTASCCAGSDCIAHGSTCRAGAEHQRSGDEDRE